MNRFSIFFLISLCQTSLAMGEIHYSPHYGHSSKTHHASKASQLTPENVKKNPDLIDDGKHYYMKLVKAQWDAYGKKEIPYHTYIDEPGDNIKFQLEHVLPHSPDVHIKEIHEVKEPTTRTTHKSKSRFAPLKEEETELEKAFRERRERRHRASAGA